MSEAKTDWFEVTLSAEDIAQLTEFERYILCVGGHIANELNAHIKLTLDLGLSPPAEKLANAHYTTISTFLIFVGSGKIREAWKELHKLTTKPAFNENILNELSNDGRTALETLKSYFKEYKNTPITRTRDEIGFHYPNIRKFSQFFKEHELDNESKFSLFLADKEVNSCYISSSHLLFQFAGSQTNRSDHVEGLKKLIDNQVDIITQLSRLINEMIAAVLKKRFEPALLEAFSKSQTHTIQPNSTRIALPVMAVNHFTEIA